jgi:hypothetical protein
MRTTALAVPDCKSILGDTAIAAFCKSEKNNATVNPALIEHVGTPDLCTIVLIFKLLPKPFNYYQSRYTPPDHWQIFMMPARNRSDKVWLPWVLPAYRQS